MKKILSFTLAIAMVLSVAVVSGSRNIAYADPDPEPILARVDNEIITESAITAAFAEIASFPDASVYAFVSDGALEIITGTSLVLPEDTKWYLMATTSAGIGNLKLEIVTDCAISNSGIIFGNPDENTSLFPVLVNSWNYEINIAEDAELTMFEDGSYNQFEFWSTGSMDQRRAAIQAYAYPLKVTMLDNSNITIKTRLDVTEDIPINVAGIVAEKGLDLLVSTGASLYIEANGGNGIGTTTGDVRINNFGTIEFKGGIHSRGTCAFNGGWSSGFLVITGGAININCPGNGNAVSWINKPVYFYDCELNIQSQPMAFNVSNITFNNVYGTIITTDAAIRAYNIQIENSTITASSFGTGDDCDGISASASINIDAASKLYATGNRSIVAGTEIVLPSGIGFLGSATQNDAVENLTQVANVLDNAGYKTPYMGTSLSDPVAKTVILGTASTPTPPPAPVYYDYDPIIKVKIPVFGDENMVKVYAELDGTKATVEDIKDEVINQVIGNDVETGIVHIDLSGLNQTVKKAVLKKNTLNKIANAIKDSNNDATGLEIDLTTAKVRFDAAATLELQNQAKGSTLWLVVDNVKKSTLNKAQKATADTLNVAKVIDAYLVSDGLRLCTAEGDGLGYGKARVMLPYKLKEGETPAIYTVYYLDDEGVIQELNAVYNIDENCFEFDLEHFSNYIIAYTTDKAESFAYMKCPQDTSCVIDPYWDSDPLAWYHDGVHYCIENGLMLGYPDGSFGPTKGIRRSEIAMTLWRIEGCPIVNDAPKIDDVSEDAWYSDAARWATAKNVMKVGEDGLFHGEDIASREELANILYAYAQTKKHYANSNDGVSWCTDNKIMLGTADGALELERIILRAEAAAMFQRTRELLVFGR